MKIIIPIIFLLAIIFLSGCEQMDLSKISEDDINRITEQVIVCESPYIRHASGCCLDQNSNNICDNDESLSDNKEIICELPYIKNADQCCLDKNNNSICDNDEENISSKCPDKCSTDRCSGKEYIACLRQEDNCYDEINKGIVTGKCDVECKIDDNCDNNEKCENYVCVEKECKQVKVPYEVEETYTEEECKEIPTEEKEAEYKITELLCEYVQITDIEQCNEYPYSMCKSGNSCSDYHHIIYSVTNYEGKSADFTFELGHIQNIGGQDRKIRISSVADSIITHTLKPYVFKEFEVEYCMTGGSNKCWIEAKEIPTIEAGVNLVTCQDVTKTRTVTKYKMETICE